MELKRMDNFLLRALLLCAGVIVVTQVLTLDELTSWLFTLTFPLTVLLWLRTIRHRITGMNILVMLTALLAVISVLVDVSIHRGTLSFSYIKKLVMFTMTLMFLQTAYTFRADQALARFTQVVVDCLTAFLLAVYLTDRDAAYTMNGYVIRYLTFNFGNPNTTGLFLTCLFMLECYRLFVREAWYWKLAHIVLAGVLIWFISLTQSRNSLLVAIVFVVFCGWLRFRSRRQLRITRFWATVFGWFPLLFAVVYMTWEETEWIQEIFSFLVSTGKSLGSRMEIWQTAVSSIWDSPLIGDYYTVSDGTGSFQLHNSHLDTAASYGIPVMILLCLLLTRYLYRNGRYYADKASYSYMLGFACTIMLGMGEAALFSGGLGIYVFAGMFLLLSNQQTENEVAP